MKKRKGAEKGASAPSRSKGSSNVDFDAIRELARIAGEFDLAEIEVDGAGRVRVSRRAGGAGAPVFHASAPSAAPERAASPVALVPAPAAAPAAASDDVLITSPFVGTFYRSPSPEAPSFVDVGQTVRKGQVVCIVEAMKLMNEIEAEADGKLLEVLVKNGAHVEYGQPLFRLAKL